MAPTTTNGEKSSTAVTTLIFDVDDTLYDVGTGFTKHRTGPLVQQFMVEKLNFPNTQAALELWSEYFERYHSTVKALTMAEQEGRLPSGAPPFDAQDLSRYWATHSKFALLSRKEQLKQQLQECPLTLVAFSNGPRIYVKRVLETLGLWELFGEERLFAVDDVAPHCKPEKEAFDVVLERLGVDSYEQCVMVEDSMKNIKRCQELGIRTIFIAGEGHLKGPNCRADQQASAAHASVDLAMETIDELQSLAPGLWQTPASFPK